MENDLIKNKYKIQMKLGDGSFGSTYKVLNNENNKEYVIKEIELDNASEEIKKDIENEGKLLSKINSKFVVKYFDSFIENSKYNLVMDFCDGESLENFINEYKTKNEFIPENIIINILKQILFGLKKIHEQNIIHRNLKPSNIFLLKGWKVKISDFGIKETNSNKINEENQIGTFIYMPPEAIKEKKYTNKTDIWSVGCILYELCTLNFIFPFSNQSSFIDNIVNDVPKKIDKMYTEKLQLLIDLLLEKDPIQRPDINLAINELNKYEIEYENSLENLKEIYESILLSKQEANNIDIENNIQQKLLATSIYLMEKESTLSKVLTNVGVGALCFAVAFVPVINVIGAMGIGAGIGLTGGIVRNQVQQSKVSFINENINIINEIFNRLIEDLRKEIDLKRIQRQSLIALSDLIFKEKISEIMNKFKQEKNINELKKNLKITLILYYLEIQIQEKIL